jgi:hypothetical protein
MAERKPVVSDESAMLRAAGWPDTLIWAMHHEGEYRLGLRNGQTLLFNRAEAHGTVWAGLDVPTIDGGVELRVSEIALVSAETPDAVAVSKAREAGEAPTPG